MAAATAPATPIKAAVEDKTMADAAVLEELPDEVKRASLEELAKLSRMLENEIKALKNDVARLNLEQKREKEHIKENTDKIKLNRQLPYLVGNVVEVCCNDWMAAYAA
jgi:26S proteasome regulatory subunit T5